MSEDSKANNSVVKEEKNKQAMNRRKLLGSLAVVGGVSAMPSNWVKPVINSVILPAHAQTSEPLSSASTSTPIPTVAPALTLTGGSLDISLLQAISPPILDFVSIVTASVPAITSGGTIITQATFLTPGTTTVSFIFVDSQAGQSQVMAGSLLAGQTLQFAGLTDSAGFVFGLEVALSPDGNTLNLSLIL